MTKNMEENEELKEAVEKLDSLSADERMQRIADLREKAILDEKAIYDKGLEVGEKKGIQENKIEIAKRMLDENLPIDLIVRVTELTREEIKKII